MNSHNNTTITGSSSSNIPYIHIDNNNFDTSSYNSTQKSSITNKILSNQPTNQTHYSSSSSSNSFPDNCNILPTFNNIGSKLPNTWRICTLNVRGLNSPSKANNTLQFFNQHQIDFLCLTETKLKNHTAKFLFPKSKQYHHLFTTNDQQPFGSGVSILINHEWAKHIQKVNYINGRLIHINLAFSGKTKIHILVSYFPASLLSNNNFVKKKCYDTLTPSSHYLIT